MERLSRRQSGIQPGGVYLDTSDKANRIISAASSTMKMPPAQMENSYRLEPRQKFPVSQSRNIIREVLETHLQERKYDQEECTMLTTVIADEIKAKVKGVAMASRYKIVCFVAIGQPGQSSVSFASRCVWNDNLDTRAEGTYKNKSVYAVGMVYGLYLE